MIAKRVLQRIEAMEPGKPFSSSVLMGLGTRAAVDQALSRLAKAGIVIRLARGIYARPKMNRFVGDVPPRPAEVAKAIAEATGTVVEVQGAEAARLLGLTTQVPSKLVFHTTGPSRRFRLGEIEVELKRVAARKLALAGRPAGLALSALWYLGKAETTATTLQTLAARLPPEEFEALRSATAVMPAWMIDAFHHYRGAVDRG